MNRQNKSERRSSNPTNSKRTGQQTNANPSSTTGKGRSVSLKNRPNTGKTTIDITKPHWILQVVSDADKAVRKISNFNRTENSFFFLLLQDELIIKKDNERNDELINMKKAWETFQIGRAEKAMQTRQRFLDSLQTKSNEQLTPEINDAIIQLSDTQTNTETLPPLDLKPFIRRKSSLNESILFDSFIEQEEFEHRQKNFNEYLKSLNIIRQYREDDYNHRSNEKIRQLEEYIDLQARIDQIRRSINEPREIFRQRFLEIERQRSQLLAVEQQRLLDEEKAQAAAAMIMPIEKKTSKGKKKKK